MSNAQLLNVLECGWDLQGKTPLFMEFQVDPRVSPYLVSSTSSLLWVSRSRNGVIRAAIRPFDTIAAFYREVIDAICVQGLKLQWGNIHPLTKTGINSAIGHVTSYDIEELDILIHPELPIDFEVPEGAELIQVDWLPEGYLVVLPRDRDFVGFVTSLRGNIVALVHNAARGVAIARMVAHEGLAVNSTKQP